jgi:hypothetical protein
MKIRFVMLTNEVLIFTCCCYDSLCFIYRFYFLNGRALVTFFFKLVLLASYCFLHNFGKPMVYPINSVGLLI